MSRSNYKFKVGDKALRVSGSFKNTYPGFVGLIVDVRPDASIVFEDDCCRYDEKCFELVKEETNVKEFDLHKDKWFIETPTKEVFKLAQLWAIEQGFAWTKEASVSTDGTLYYPVEVKSFGGNHIKSGLLGRGYREFYEREGHKEIKLTFKTVVDTVEYPEPEIVETPSQKELRILKEQIEQLTQQANKLETTLKGEV